MENVSIRISKNIFGINAELRPLRKTTHVKWTLTSNESVVQSFQGMDEWVWKVALCEPLGVFKVGVQLYDGDNLYATGLSQDLSFGMNLQHVAPRGVLKSGPNEYPASFKELIYLESRKAFRKPEYTAWLLDNKTNAYNFAEGLGFDTPIIERAPVSYRDLDLEPGTVVKPLTGVMSQGVFIVTSSNISEVFNGNTYDNVADVRDRMKSLVDSGTIRRDEWIKERLITSDVQPGEPARDLKFYTFYGQVKLILETTRTGSVKRCWYDQSLNMINTGKYNNNLFEGSGIPVRYIEGAQEISLEVPAPFIRVDFLASTNGPVLNEITPRPGGSNQFSPRIDRMLGESLIAADARLKQDFLIGKKFSKFNQLRIAKA